MLNMTDGVANEIVLVTGEVNPLYVELKTAVVYLWEADWYDLVTNSPVYYSKWWLDLYYNNPRHLFVETALAMFIVWLMFIRPTVDPNKSSENARLTQKEKDDLIATWEPEPLAPALNMRDRALLDSVVQITSMDGNYVTINGQKSKLLNLTSGDFLSFGQDAEVKTAAGNALDKYGCGACGPRGFYGTIDQHLNLETAMSEFMKTEQAISYSDGASTVASAISAFAKKGDLLLIDRGASEPILTGANLSRATIQFFNHNDIDHLRKMLTSIHSDDKRLKRDATQQRRFIVVEGLYKNTGELCKLKEIMDLKTEFCYRLILDESNSFGTIGDTGKGAIEHFGVKVEDVEVLTVAMDTTLVSVGGLCVGSREIIDHQRLSGAGYCFSAAAPPFLAATAIATLEKMKKNPSTLKSLRTNVKRFYDGVQSLSKFTTISSDISPLQHMTLKINKSWEEDESTLMAVEKEMAKKGFLVSYCKYNEKAVNEMKKCGGRPTLRINLNSTLKLAEIDKIVAALGASSLSLKL